MFLADKRLFLNKNLYLISYKINQDINYDIMSYNERIKACQDINVSQLQLIVWIQITSDRIIKLHF